jgi:MFS transporter, OFA family, oxalate/formate antiporter
VKTPTTHTRAWIVVLAGAGLNLAIGIIYTWSIFGRALMVSWGWTAPAAALPYAVALGVMSLPLALAGRAQDVFGPRLTASAGGGLMGLGLIVASRVGPQNPVPAIVGFGVIAAFGVALAFSSSAPPALKWFPQAERGLISGIIIAGFSLAALYNAPLVEALLRGIGINGAFFSLGIAFLLITLALAQLLSNPPAGYVPDKTSSPRPTKRVSGEVEYEWRETIRSRSFYLFWAMFALSTFSGLMIIGHMAQIVESQLRVNLGYALVAVLAIGNTAGRLAIGRAADRLGPKTAMLLVFLLQAAIMGVFAWLATLLLLVVGAFAVGFTYGSTMALFVLVSADYFGTKNMGVNLGLLFTGWGAGGVFGSMAAGYIVHATGSFASAFAVATVLSVVGAGLTFLIKPPSAV